MISIKEIENAIIKAFKNTIIDYNSDMIELEEDCRACFYHHMRQFIEDNDGLQMLLSHNVEFVNRTIKPDIFIFRDNTYLVAIEIKIDAKNKYNRVKATKDRNRLRDFRDDIHKSYFIRFDKVDTGYRFVKKNWHNAYFNELFFIQSNDKAGRFNVLRNKMNVEYYQWDDITSSL